MANEIITSDLERSADVRSAVYELALADRGFLTPESYGQILDAGDVAGLGTHVVRVTRQGLDGYDLMGDGSEITDVANTAYTDASVTVTVARNSLSYDASTLAISTDPILRMERLYQSLMASGSATFTNDVAALMDGFSTQAGTSGVSQSLASLLEAVTILEAANVPGPYLGVMHSRQWGAVRLEHYLNAGGAIQYEAPISTGAASATGYKGRLFGGLDIFVANRGIATSGSDYKGGVMGQAALLMAKLTPVVEDASRQAVMGNTMVEYGRVPGAAKSEYHGHKFYGLVEFEDTRGVELIGTA